MEALFEIIFQFFGEIVLQSAFELLGEGVARLVRRSRHPLANFLWSAAAGAALGGLSLWLLPHALLPAGALRLAYLVVAPPMIGWAMLSLRNWRGLEKEAGDRDYFVNATTFALAFAAARYLFAA